MPGGVDFKTVPDPKTLVRYSDAQLYALALFLYSLEPPRTRTNRLRSVCAGKRIFHSEGCANCYTPALYTNNKLTLAIGFQIPEAHQHRCDILPVVVGTDPFLTMQTRRGTFSWSEYTYDGRIFRHSRAPE